MKIFVLLVVLALLGRTKAVCDDSDPLTLTADAFQYSPSGNPFNSVYKEWWFFTFSDTTADIAFCMGYAVTDPAKQFGKESSGVSGMFWPNFQKNASNLQLVTDDYTYADFSGSSQNATVSIATNHIRVIDATTYQVEGASNDSSLQWNLTYTQQVPACREKFQFPDLLELDWISYMPTAQVDGYVVSNGKKIPISGKGYHDHNWGVWPASIFNWVWAQYGDPSQDFALVMGAYNVPLTKDYIGYVFLRVNGTKVKIGTLCADSYSLTPLEFQEWEGHKFSVHNHVEVKGGDWWLQIDYVMQVSGPNPGGVGLNLLVFEQVSQFNVSLLQSDGKGSWTNRVQSIGLGFNEWSDVIKI